MTANVKRKEGETKSHELKIMPRDFLAMYENRREFHIVFNYNLDLMVGDLVTFIPLHTMKGKIEGLPPLVREIKYITGDSPALKGQGIVFGFKPATEVKFNFGQAPK